MRRTPRLCGRGGGAVGRGVALPHSVPLPSLGRQQSGCQWRCAVHGGRGPPYHSGSCSPGFSGCDLCGVLARWRGLACSSRAPWEPAAGAGGRVALRLLSRAGGGPSLLPRGVGAGAPAACGPVGGRGGGCRAAASLLPFWAAACGTQILAPLASSARSLPACASILFCCARCSGTLLWARGSRSSCRSPHRVAIPSGGGGRLLGSRGGGGPRLWLPSRGGCGGGGLGGPPPRPLSGLSGWGGSGGGPLVPWRRLLSAEGGGGRHGSPGLGGQPSAGGSRPSPAPLHLEPDPRAGPRWPARGGREG